jgi:hypothetical protein
MGDMEHAGEANPGRQTPRPEFADSINTRDTSRKVAAVISPKGRKAKRNPQRTTFEPEIALRIREIS